MQFHNEEASVVLRHSVHSACHRNLFACIDIRSPCIYVKQTTDKTLNI